MSVLVLDELNEEVFPGEIQAVLESVNLNSLKVRRFDFEPLITYAVIGE